MPSKKSEKKQKASKKKNQNEQVGDELKDGQLEKVAGGFYKAPATFDTKAPPDPLEGPKPSTDGGGAIPTSPEPDGGGTITKKLPDGGM